MKTRAETRLESLRMAVSLGVSKSIPWQDIIPTAMEFYRWVDDDPDDKPDVAKLAERFRVQK